LLSAEKTRSSDSFTAASGKPTRTSLGSPTSPAFTSTWTTSASIPCRAADAIVANMARISSARLPAIRRLFRRNPGGRGATRNLGDVVFDRGQVVIRTVGVGASEEAIYSLKIDFELSLYELPPESRRALDEIGVGFEGTALGRNVGVFVCFVEFAVE